MDWVKNMLLELRKSIDDAKARGETRDEVEGSKPLKQQTLW
ncbi:hypothetical protein [Bradyrhizobium agreste]|nr:hypothetical protein [Bradyrhizobium agreste]